MPPSVTIPPMVSVFNRMVGWVSEAYAGAIPVSAAYEAANVAVYYPIILPAPCIVRRVWWANGATTSGATIEVGIYSDDGYGPGTKLISGSAAQGSSGVVQFVDVTDVSLPPGRYWIAVSSSSATNTTLYRSALSGVYMDAACRFEEASANPLPATATPVESTGVNIYLGGFSTTASP